MLYLLYGNNVQVCAFFWLEEFYSYTEKTQQKGQRKQYKTKRHEENYVQRTTIYNSHIGNQQIISSDTAYFLCVKQPIQLIGHL